MTSGCNLDLVLLRIGLQINEIEASYITIHKVYFIFWGPFKFGGPVRSHGPHGPRDTPDQARVELSKASQYLGMVVVAFAALLLSLLDSSSFSCSSLRRFFVWLGVELLPALISKVHLVTSMAWIKQTASLIEGSVYLTICALLVSFSHG